METAPPPAPRYHPYHPFLPDLHPALLHRYIYSEPLAPLDLSVKSSPITPPCTPPPKHKIFRHFEEERRDGESERREEDDASPEAKKLKFTQQFFEELKSSLPTRAGTPPPSSRESTDTRDVEERPRKTCKPPPAPTKKSKAVRRLQFDEDKTSPVSGTIIRELADDETLVVRKGDIDPAFNVVEVTDEAKAVIASIDNKLGRYICRLCRKLYPDAFALAQHRCERIVNIEYRCPECDKVFNCPANLASHRRWHKPRTGVGGKPAAKPPAPEPSVLDPAAEGGARFACKVCGKEFRRQAYLRKHYQAHAVAAPVPAPAPAEPERSAFRQVQPAHRAEPLRDDNYNTFWGKLPRADFPLAEACCERAHSPASLLHSEDSRSLDITGSEDEGDEAG